ncbi:MULTISPECIES: (2Fe-2S)-binding protein [Pseudooceanicola]|uniref:(2Fe-2S)-binding protein n=1 Tax=Pseudooceanicola TaxID=1679449 RepID=UPI00192633E8|nr:MULTISPECIES: (2Fe-2S)-binding protein [Pseudooceanicola]
MASRQLRFVLNGRPVQGEVDPTRSLLDVLRTDFALKGPKYGCGKGQCGACSVLVGGQVARACVLRAGRVAGQEVTTLEGLAPDGRLHPVQQAFIDRQGAQCGYCLNGMVISAVALLRQDPAPDRARVEAALRDNLCRCGTHREIVASVLLASGAQADD